MYIFSETGRVSVQKPVGAIIFKMKGFDYV